MKGIAAQTIWTERLELRPLRTDDAVEMAAVLDDPALHTFTGGAPLGSAELRARYARWAAGSGDPAVDWLNWVIADRADGRLTGTVQATLTDSRHGPVAEVAWVVGTAWQGRGIAGEAARGLVGWLAGQGVTLVLAHVHPDHAASAAVARAAGLAPTDVWYDGELRWELALG